MQARFKQHQACISSRLEMSKSLMSSWRDASQRQCLHETTVAAALHKAQLRIASTALHLWKLWVDTRKQKWVAVELSFSFHQHWAQSNRFQAWHAWCCKTRCAGIPWNGHSCHSSFLREHACAVQCIGCRKDNACACTPSCCMLSLLSTAIHLPPAAMPGEHMCLTPSVEGWLTCTTSHGASCWHLENCV